MSRGVSTGSIEPRPTGSGDESLFVGRSDERARIAAAIAAGRRVLTLSGAAGIGKSRLAHRVALDFTGDGVSRSVVYSLSDREDASVAEVLEQARSRVAATKHGRTLALFDDADDAHDAIAQLIRARIDSDPSEVFLITSRAPLEIPSEHRIELGALCTSDALALFADRALTSRGTPLDRGELAAARVLVEALDGNPLALCQAASRLDVFAVAELVARLDRRFEWLRFGSRSAKKRHRAFDSVLADELMRLSADERVAFVRCALFEAPFDVAIAETLLARPLAERAYDAISTLRRRGLVVASSEANAPGLLKISSTTRLFAQSQIDTVDDGNEARADHARAVLFAITRAKKARGDSHRDQAPTRFDRDVIAALERVHETHPELGLELLERGEPILGRRLAPSRAVAIFDAVGRGLAGLASPFQSRLGRVRALVACHIDELAADDAFTNALERDDPAVALFAARRAFADGDATSAARYASAAAAHARARRDRRLETVALSSVADAHQAASNDSEAFEWSERALEAYVEDAEPWGEAIELARMAELAARLGRPAESFAIVDSARASFIALEDVRGTVACEVIAAWSLLDLGQSAEATRRAALAIESADGHALESLSVVARAVAAFAALESDRLSEAVQLAQEATLRLVSERSRRHERRAYATLGTTLLFAGRAKDAERAFEAAERSTLGPRRPVRLELDRAWHRVASALADRPRAQIEAQALDLDSVRSRADRMTLRLLAATADLVYARGLGDAGRETRRRCVELARLLLVDAWSSPPGELQPPLAQFAYEVRAAARLLSAELPVAETIRPPRPATVLRYTARSEIVVPPHGGPIDFRRRPVLRRIFQRLLEHRRSGAGGALSWQELLEAGWPGERVGAESGFGRVRTAVWTLRRLGLATVLVTQESGYELTSEFELEEVEMQATASMKPG